MRRCLVLVVLCHLSASLWGLSWDGTVRIVELEPQDQDCLVEWTFTNDGASPIHLERVRTSGKEVVASLDGRTWPPGASGVVSAMIDCRELAAPVRRHVVLTLKQEGAAEAMDHVLEADLRVPMAIETEGTVMYWRRRVMESDGAWPAQENRLAAVAGRDLRVTGLDLGAAPHFTASLRMADGRVYDPAQHDFPAVLRVVPRPGFDGNRTERIRILTDHDIPRFAAVPIKVIVFDSDDTHRVGEAVPFSR